MTTETIHTIPILEACRALGLTWEKDSGGNSYFKSPRVSDQRTGSLSVHPGKSVWHDYATGESGDVISLVQYVTQTDFKSAMTWFETHFSSLSVGNIPSEKPRSAKTRSTQAHQMMENAANHPQIALFNPALANNASVARGVQQGAIEVLEVRELFSYPLKNYLASRCIPPELAALYVKEIRYRNAGKDFYAIGFPNDAGGFDLRSASFKGAIAPKEVSFFCGSISGPKKLNVFEGFMDFLSAMVYFKTDRPAWDTVILNSTSMINHIKPLLTYYLEVDSYLDADPAGELALAKLRAVCGHIKDRSILYRNHSFPNGEPVQDFNDWLKYLQKKDENHA
jgi:hypothetical protein